MNRPDKLNALTSDMYQGIKEHLAQAAEDDGIDAIVITGSGKSFSSGGDLKEVLDHLGSDPSELDYFWDSLPFEALRNISKTTIAAVNGICLAGGLTLALLCDILIAADTAVFGNPQGRVGLADSSAPALLYGRVGLAQAKYLLMTGTTIGAEEALRIGLVTQVVKYDELDLRIEGLIAELRATSDGARAQYKAHFNSLTPYPEHRTAFPPEAKRRLEAFASRP